MFAVSGKWDRLRHWEEDNYRLFVSGYYNQTTTTRCDIYVLCDICYLLSSWNGDICEIGDFSLSFSKPLPSATRSPLQMLILKELMSDLPRILSFVTTTKNEIYIVLHNSTRGKIWDVGWKSDLFLWQRCFSLCAKDSRHYFGNTDLTPFIVPLHIRVSSVNWLCIHRHACGKFSRFLPDKLLWRKVAQRTVRPGGVIIDTPLLDNPSGMLKTNSRLSTHLLICRWSSRYMCSQRVYPDGWT